MTEEDALNDSLMPFAELNRLRAVQMSVGRGMPVCVNEGDLSNLLNYIEKLRYCALNLLPRFDDVVMPDSGYISPLEYSCEYLRFVM